MVTIRLSRHGRHKRPFYRIVVSDSRSPRDGRFIEVVGTYDPLARPPRVEVDRVRIEGWFQRGAKPSLTVQRILRTAGGPEQSAGGST